MEDTKNANVIALRTAGVHTFEDAANVIARLLGEIQQLQAGPAAQKPPNDFDEWMANPYTKVLQKSIREDYVPKYDRPATGEAAAQESCPYCSSDHGEIREVFFNQTCSGCARRFSQSCRQ